MLIALLVVVTLVGMCTGGDSGFSLTTMKVQDYMKLGKKRPAVGVDVGEDRESLQYHQVTTCAKRIPGGCIDYKGRVIRTEGRTTVRTENTKERYRREADSQFKNGLMQTTLTRRGNGLTNGGSLTARADFKTNSGVEFMGAVGYNSRVNDFQFKGGSDILQVHTGSQGKAGDLKVHLFKAEYVNGKVASAYGSVKSKNFRGAVLGRATLGFEGRAIASASFSPQDRKFEAALGGDAVLGARLTGQAQGMYRGVGGAAIGRVGVGLGVEGSAKAFCELKGKCGFGVKVGGYLGIGGTAGFRVEVDIPEVRKQLGDAATSARNAADATMNWVRNKFSGNQVSPGSRGRNKRRQSRKEKDGKNSDPKNKKTKTSSGTKSRRDRSRQRNSGNRTPVTPSRGSRGRNQSRQRRRNTNNTVPKTRPRNNGRPGNKARPRNTGRSKSNPKRSSSNSKVSGRNRVKKQPRRKTPVRAPPPTPTKKRRGR